jgi:hypothetical protein
MIGKKDMIYLSLHESLGSWGLPNNTSEQKSTSKLEQPALTSYTHHLKKVESELLKQTAAYLEQKKVLELGNIPKYQRSLYDSQYEQHANPIRAKIKSSIEELKNGFEKAISKFESDLNETNNIFVKIMEPLCSILFSKLPMVGLSFSTKGFLDVFDRLKKAEQETQELRVSMKRG